MSGFGVTIYVGLGSSPLTLDANGNLELQLNFPLAAGMCGQRFHFQAFLDDPSSPAVFPVTHTNAVEWFMGH